MFFEGKQDIESRLGFVPAYFMPSLEHPVQLDRLWNQFRAEFLGNPLPELFKSKLFSYLARFEAQPSSLLVWGAALGGLGLKGGEVLRHLSRPLLSLGEALAELDSLPRAQASWPIEQDSQENSLLYAAAAWYRASGLEEDRLRAKFREVLSPEWFDAIFFFLAYAKTYLAWASAHPESMAREDLRVQKFFVPLLAEEPALGEFFRDYAAIVADQEAARLGAKEKEHQELVVQERMVRESLEQALDSAGMEAWSFPLAADGVPVGFVDLVSPLDAKELARFSEAAEDLRISGKIEIEVVTAESPARWFRVKGSVFAAQTSGPARASGTLKDITREKEIALRLEAAREERASARAILEGQKNALELTLGGAGFEEVLSALLITIETHLADGVRCSVLLVDESGKRLRHGAAPSLPEEYCQAIDGLEFGPEVGSCGHAAALGVPVIARDIQTDPYWANFRELAEAFDLRSCWSTPIFSSDRRVLGTLALYYPEPRVPTYREEAIVTLMGGTVGLVLERRQEQERRARADLALRESQKSALRDREKLETTLSRTAAAICIFRGPDQVFEFVNEQFRAAVGDRDFIGQPLLRVVREVENQPIYASIRKVWETGKSFRGREELVNLLGRDGKIHARYFDISLEPVLGADGMEAIIQTGIDVTEQVEARRLVEEERERFRTYLNQSGVPTATLIGPDFVYAMANQPYVEMLNRKGDIIGRSLQSIFPEVGAQGIFELLNSVYHQGKTVSLPNLELFLDLDGDGELERHYFDVNYSPIRNSHGEIEGVLVVAPKVTERVEAELENRNQTAWLESVLEELPLPFFLVQPSTGAIAFANRRGREFTGVEMVGHATETRADKPFQLFDGEDNPLPLSEAPSARIARGEVLKGAETVVVTPRGKFFFQNFSHTLKGAHGFAPTALLAMLDVSQEKNILARLKTSQAQLALALATANLGFYDWDVVENRVTYSEQMKKDWEITSDLEGGSLLAATSRIHEEDRARVEGEIETAMRERRPYASQYRLRLPSGQIRWTTVRGQVTYSFAGEPVRFFGTAMDVTAQKDLELEMKAAREAADAANLAKSAFLANMSHEIRTPLGAITGFVDLMRRSSFRREDMEEYLSVIDRNSVQLLRIVDDILDLSKVEAGKLLIEKETFSLTTLLSDFSSLMSFRAAENGIAFSLKATGPLPRELHSDATRIRQILFNVVGNAIKFTEKGSVAVEIAYQECMLRFRVKDSGRGISAAQAERLFQAFSQADSSTTRRFGGTGLGLVLTRKLCEAMGGSFRLVESELGVGSTFEAAVMAEASSASEFVSADAWDFETQAEAPAPKRELDGLRILFVDDSKDNQRLVSIILKEEGASVESAFDGIEGVEKARDGDFDVVLMDMQMPRMDGHEATAALRSMSYARPIIALTAHAMKEEREKAFRSGVSDFLTKPIQRQDLIETVKRWQFRPRGNGKVIVVEDDEDIRALLMDLLDGLGITSIPAANAKEAREQFSVEPALVLLDLTLPDANGEDLCREIKASYPSTKVIVISGWGDLKQKAAAMGADDYLQKPVDIDKFESEVRRLMGLS